MKRLANAEQQVREFANRLGVYERLFKSKRDEWNRLCVAMDTFGDTAAALLHFEESGLGSTADERYLRLYGTFQAIILQQDAIKTIYTIYVGKYPSISKDSGWRRCRDLRNLATGHPLDAHGAPEQGKLRVFISRPTISEHGFDLIICQKKCPDLIVDHVDLEEPYERYKNEALDLIAVIQGEYASMAPQV